MKYVTLFFLIILWNLADSIVYLEEVCDFVPYPSVSWSSFGELKATRNKYYSVGKNCSFIFYSPYEVIISIKKIDFRPGCHDYLKISDGTKKIALCGNKNERDTNMQFFGKTVQLNYFTEEGGPSTEGFIGFHLTHTLSEKNESCDKWNTIRCKNGYCIRKQYVCDGNNNCGDFTDENSCDIGRGILLIIAMPIVCIMGVITGFCTSIALGIVIKYSLSKFQRSENVELHENARGLQVLLFFLACHIFRQRRTSSNQRHSRNQTAPDLPEISESERF